MSRSGPHGRLLLLVLVAMSLGLPRAWPVERAAATPRLAAQSSESLASAVDLARRETGGRVLSVTQLAGRGAGYRIRLLLEGGRVTTVEVDDSGDRRGGR